MSISRRIKSGAIVCGMTRLIAILLLLSCAAMCHAIPREFKLTEPSRPANLFEAADEHEESAIEQYVSNSKWRPLSLEWHLGLIGAKRTMWSGAMGVGFPITGLIGFSVRAEYNMDLGASRDYRPQTRSVVLEPGVRFHLDFDENIALYSQHGLAIGLRLDYFKLDKRLNDDDLGQILSIGVGTVNTVGLEFGTRQYRGYVETGLRTQFQVFQQADNDVKDYRRDIQEGFRFQWLVCRVGFRLYL